MTTLKEFNKLFNLYYNPFVRFATSYVRDTSVAEEITSEAFSIFWEKHQSIPEVTNYPAYILTIVKNLSLNYLKRSILKQNTQDRMQKAIEWELTTRINNLEVCDPEYLFSKDVESILHATINKLPKRTKEVFLLSRFEQKTHKEIADTLNITTKGVEYHISQAISRLKVSLKDYLPMSIFIFIDFLFFY